MSNKQRGQEALDKLERELKSRDRAEKARPLKVVVASLAAILVICGGIWYAATRGGEEDLKADDPANSSAESTPETPERPEAKPLALTRSTPLADTVSCSYPTENAGEALKDATPPEKTEGVSTEGTVTITLNTSQGPIDMELDRSVAPCTVNAVEHLAKTKYYDDTICHRITTQGIYVLQCGDPSAKSSGGPGFQFANEYPTDETDAEAMNMPVIYPKGSIAMANAGPDTNGSQFFLNYEDSPLPPAYTYFGKIGDEGMKTLAQIAEKGAENGVPDGAPAEEVRIQTAEVK